MFKHNGVKYICSCRLKGLLILQLVFCCIVNKFCWLFFALQHFVVENEVHAQDYPFRNLVSAFKKSGQSHVKGDCNSLAFSFKNTAEMMCWVSRKVGRKEKEC